MLIMIDHHSPIIIDPGRFPTTLAIQLGTIEERPFYGVFSGRHDGFEPHEEEKLLPVVEKDEFLTIYVVDRPDIKAPRNQCRRYHYVAIIWELGVYVDGPDSCLFTLEEHHRDNGSHCWSVSFKHIRLVLQDYEPGYLTRTR
jgi:hypothetical protein